MYSKFVRLDPDTFQKVRKEALTMQIMTGKPCPIGLVLKKIIDNYYKNREEKSSENS